MIRMQKPQSTEGVSTVADTTNTAAQGQNEKPGKLEYYEGKLRPVVDASRSGWWRFHEHYDRNGYCDNSARGY